MIQQDFADQKKLVREKLQHAEAQVENLRARVDPSSMEPQEALPKELQRQARTWHRGNPGEPH
eukprot:758966-Prorocentrum_lima.AAC.1